MARTGFIHDKMDVKFLVLYVLDRVEFPVDLAVLTDLCMCDNGVDYFDLVQAINDLKETGHLYQFDDGQYAITQQGRRDGRICEDNLAFSLRQKCDKNVAVLNQQLRLLHQTYTQVTPEKEGGFTLRISLNDKQTNLLELNLHCPHQEQAWKIANAFQTNPYQAYHTMLGDLINPNEPEKPQ